MLCSGLGRLYQINIEVVQGRLRGDGPVSGELVEVGFC